MSVDFAYESRLLSLAKVKSYGQGGERSSTGLLEPHSASYEEAKAAAQAAYRTALRKDAWDDVVRAVATVFRKYATVAEAVEELESTK